MCKSWRSWAILYVHTWLQDSDENCTWGWLWAAWDPACCGCASAMAARYIKFCCSLAWYLHNQQDVIHLPRRIRRLQNVISFESACYICYKTSLQQASFSIHSRSDPDTIILTQAALINLEEHFPAAAALAHTSYNNLGLSSCAQEALLTKCLELWSSRLIGFWTHSQKFSLWRVFVTSI